MWGQFSRHNAGSEPDGLDNRLAAVCATGATGAGRRHGCAGIVRAHPGGLSPHRLGHREAGCANRVCYWRGITALVALLLLAGCPAVRRLD